MAEFEEYEVEETSYEDETTNDYEDNQEYFENNEVDDYQKEKARREKAEKALVDLKKQLKETKTDTKDI
jgi:hypothetical protein